MTDEIGDPYDYLVSKRFELTGRETSPGQNEDEIERLRGFGVIAADPDAPWTCDVIDKLNTLLREELAANYRAELMKAYNLVEATKIAETTKAETTEQAERARFFHQPQSAADLVHYGRLPSWTVDEALSLSFGKDPEQVNWGTVSSHVETSDFAKNYAKRRHLMLSAIVAKQFGSPVAVAPNQFAKWASRQHIELPQALLEGIEKACRTNRTAAIEQSSRSREHETLKKMVIAMAIKWAGYRGEPGSPAVAKIHGALAEVDLTLDEATILKFLKASGEGLDWIPIRSR